MHKRIKKHAAEGYPPAACNIQLCFILLTS